MKRALNATRALLLAAAVLPWGGCAKAPEHKPLIGILMFADYQDAIVEGLINGLEEFGYEAGKNIEYRILNAQAYRAALPKLAGELAALRPAALCPVGGPETRA